jgi:hypothetical protein
LNISQVLANIADKNCIYFQLKNAIDFAIQYGFQPLMEKENPNLS